MNAHATGDAIALAGAAVFALAAVGIGRIARHHNHRHQDQPCQDEPTAATSPPAEPKSTKH